MISDLGRKVKIKLKNVMADVSTYAGSNCKALHPDVVCDVSCRTRRSALVQPAACSHSGVFMFDRIARVTSLAKIWKL
jgi:hypothetical protein